MSRARTLERRRERRRESWWGEETGEETGERGGAYLMLQRNTVDWSGSCVAHYSADTHLLPVLWPGPVVERSLLGLGDPERSLVLLPKDGKEYTRVGFLPRILSELLVCQGLGDGEGVPMVSQPAFTRHKIHPHVGHFS